MALKIILCLIIVCELIGLATRSFGRLLKTFIFYTQLSNLAAFLSACLLLVFGPASFITAFRYLSVCMLWMTMLVTVFILVPTIKNTKLLLWSRVGFTLHLLCPVLNTVSYLFFEPHVSAHAIVIPAAVTLIYGVIMLYMNCIRKVDGPYPFLRVHNQSATATVLWILLLLVLISAIGSGVYFAAAAF
ncbi:MAG: hypothetical protein IJM63_00925 [Solobacterium sp.]|nr:hypothetical protein [Solobacterium sp.]MBQ9823032.1 hypothetical protein [Solobacterium sp.]